MNNILITGGSGFIGTNLIESLIPKTNVTILNLDIKNPKIDSHNAFWVKVDIRDKSLLKSTIEKFNPTIVIHFAARTDLNGTSIEDYSTNTIGTQNVVEVLNEIDFLGIALFTSSMYVCEPGYKPKNFDDYKPHTTYGESKVKTEIIVKSIIKKYTSAIIRPTSIWGPWFGEPYSDFFDVVLSKKYIHVGKYSCKKTYGYIENTIAQIEAIINSPHEIINKKVFYLGDWPEYPIDEWANEIAETVTYKIKIFPLWFFKGLGIFGDLCKMVGLKFPMTSFRLKNMTTDNIQNLEVIRNILPDLPVSRKIGVNKTVDWLKNNKAK
jgi:nucleoside-diphosphate-sugar epimerase